MAISDVLEKIGQGVKTAGRAAVPVLERTAEVVSGEAPEIDAEKRKQQYALEDQQIATKASLLENQLSMGQKYGTLTPQQQQQYVDQISQLYSHPRHAGTLMEKLRKAIHPQGAYAQGPQAALPNANPPGGTAAADEANAEKLAAAKLAAKPKKEFDTYLDKYVQSHGLGSVDQMTEAQYEDALREYGNSRRAERLTTKVVEDPDSPTHFSAATWDLTTGKLVSSFPGVLPPRGMIPTDRVSKSTDQYGNTVVTVSQMTPQLPGATSVPTHPEPPKDTKTGARSVGGILGGAQHKTLAKPVSTAASKTTPATVLSGGKKQLDANGHIPDGVGNSQVREFANQLLDDRDVDKIPAKARGPAAELARQYGWEQGKFTPKEQTLLKESTNFLREAQTNPSLTVLDDFGSRAKLSQLTKNTDHAGMLGTLATLAASGTETPQEAEFIRMYNQLVGTISGLSQLVRSGRATEAQIDRLKNELPNPLTTTSSADAKARLQRLMQEVDIATQKGSFTGTAAPSSDNVIVVSPEDLE